MKLSIIDTEKITTYDVAWVDITTPAGNMVVQRHHVPMVVELLSGHELLFQMMTGEQNSMMIHHAIAHVTREEVKILIPAVV